MKKLTSILAALVLAATACGGSDPGEAEDKGIAALEEDKDKGSGAEPKGGAKKKPGGTGSKDKGGTKKPGTTNPGGGGGGGSQPSTGGGSGTAPGNGNDNDNEGGGGSPARATITPVPQGEYTYATQGSRTINGNTTNLPKTTFLAAGAPADGVQRQARDLRDSEGNGTLTETDLHYRSGSVFLSRVKVTSRFQGGITDVREFVLPRPQLVAPKSGGPGFTRTFTMQGSGTRAKVTVRAHRWENVAVAGEQMRSLLVETDIRFSGSLEGYQRSMTWFWPEHLLPLKEQVETDVRNGPIRLQSTYQAQVEQLR